MSSDSTSLPVIDGKYQLVRKLGEGGMGAVYEARHRGTGRRVALKVIAGSSLAKNPEVVSRFQREAMASGAIESQYIAQVLDTGVDPATGSPYTAMELLVGEDLEQAIRRLGPLPSDLALRIVLQACLGLRKAHEAGVVHRDIKPANLFLAKREDGDVVVKLLDFGIAKVKQDQLSSSEGAGLTRTGAMLGSPLYMSPEQARGKKDLDHRTDIWSLGVVLYEALAGTTPHGHVDTLGELILQICSTAPPHIQDRAPWVAPAVAAIVHKALALDPVERFASTADMMTALRGELPNGFTVTETMFAPLSPEIRGAVANKLELSSRGRAPAPSYAQLPVEAVTGASAGSTMTGVAKTNGAGRAKRAPMRVVLPVSLVLAAIAGGGAWRLAVSQRPAEVTSAAPPVSAPSTPVETAPSAAVSPAQAKRTVRVVVLPTGAEAEVDGARATVRDGVVTITGEIGSVHRVRLSMADNATTADVTIGEDGPMPAKVELEAAPPKTPAQAARLRAARPALPAAPAPKAPGGMHMDMK